MDPGTTFSAVLIDALIAKSQLSMLRSGLATVRADLSIGKRRWQVWWEGADDVISGVGMSSLRPSLFHDKTGGL